MKSDNNNERDANRDPITGEPGSHPVATGLGSAAGAAGWLLLVTALVGWLTAYLGWFWVTAAGITGGVHILVVITAWLLIRARLKSTLWFADNLNELKKDRTWLQGKTTKS